MLYNILFLIHLYVLEISHLLNGCCVCDWVLADAHFPTSSVCRSGPREIRADGLCDLLMKHFIRVSQCEAVDIF